MLERPLNKTDSIKKAACVTTEMFKCSFIQGRTAKA